MIRILSRRRALGIAVALLGACKHLDPAAASLAERNTRYDVPFNSVTLLDAVLKRNVVVEQTGSKRSATNTLVAWALLRNRTDDAVLISVRTRFFDANKLPLDDSDWSAVYLDRRGLRTYELPSTTPDATYYSIEIMHGR